MFDSIQAHSMTSGDDPAPREEAPASGVGLRAFSNEQLHVAVVDVQPKREFRLVTGQISSQDGRPQLGERLCLVPSAASPCFANELLREALCLAR